MNTIVITIISLCAIGIASAVILYFVARKFKVEEDPRIDTVESLLPGANCGGCGYPGCRGLAEAAVKSADMEGIFCPVGGSEVMNKMAVALGREIAAQAPRIAVVRCNGSCSNRPRTSIYDGASSCAVEHSLYVGDTACSFGCLGCGDCVAACPFDAIHMNTETGLPEVDEAKCVACGACVKACPRNIIELRNKGPKDRRVFVSCVNKDKGGIARKACQVACIGCMKCAKECPFEAITVENNLAYIDFAKCRLCRKCVSVCPTGAIHEVNFPERKITPPVAQPAKPAVAAAQTTQVNTTSPAAPETQPEPIKPAKETPQQTESSPAKAEEKESSSPAVTKELKAAVRETQPLEEKENTPIAGKKPATEEEIDFKI